MKLSTIAIAAATVMSAPAFADTVTNLFGSNTSFYYVSGSTALGTTFKQIVNGVCNTKADGSSGVVEIDSGSNGEIEVCTTSGSRAPWSASGGPFAIVKNDNGGSYTGLYNVYAAAAAVTANPANTTTGVISGWPDINNITVVTDANGVITKYTAGTDTTSRRADGALSDVKAAIFLGLKNTGAWDNSATAAFNVPDGNLVTSTNFGGQGFAVGVSDALYLDMQANQIATGRLPSTCVANTADFSGVCQPSISTQEYAAMVNKSASSYRTAPTSLVGSANNGGGNVINICKRTPKSGTQANSNAYFLKNPCSGATPFNGFANVLTGVSSLGVKTAPNVALTAASNPQGLIGTYYTNLNVFEGNATSDITYCLSDRNAGLPPTQPAATDGKGTYAVGVISTDATAGVSGMAATGWHYVRLNGVSPDHNLDGTVDASHRANVVTGLYDFTSEMEMSWDKRGTNSAIMQGLRDELATPDSMTTSVGFFQLSGSINPKTNAALTNSYAPGQVAKGNRSGNVCAPIVMQE